MRLRYTGWTLLGLGVALISLLLFTKGKSALLLIPLFFAISWGGKRRDGGPPDSPYPPIKP